METRRMGNDLYGKLLDRIREQSYRTRQMGFVKVVGRTRVQPMMFRTHSPWCRRFNLLSHEWLAITRVLPLLTDAYAQYNSYNSCYTTVQACSTEPYFYNTWRLPGQFIRMLFGNNNIFIFKKILSRKNNLTIWPIHAGFLGWKNHSYFCTSISLSYM